MNRLNQKRFKLLFIQNNMANAKKEKSDSERISKIIQEAIDLERTATALRRDRKKETAEEIGAMYESAGDLRFRARDFINAEENYIQAQRYGFPYSPEKQEEINKKLNKLRFEKKMTLVNKFAIISTLTLVIAFFFVTSNLTGFSVLNLNYDNSRWFGSCFFVCGLIFAFIYLKGKNKK